MKLYLLLFILTISQIIEQAATPASADTIKPATNQGTDVDHIPPKNKDSANSESFNDFRSFLFNHALSQKTIQSLIDNGINTMGHLHQIEMDDINDICDECGISTLEKIKFKSAIKPLQSLSHTALVCIIIPSLLLIAYFRNASEEIFKTISDALWVILIFIAQALLSIMTCCITLDNIKWLFTFLRSFAYTLITELAKRSMKMRQIPHQMMSEKEVTVNKEKVKTKRVQIEEEEIAKKRDEEQVELKEEVSSTGPAQPVAVHPCCKPLEKECMEQKEEEEVTEEPEQEGGQEKTPPQLDDQKENHSLDAIKETNNVKNEPNDTKGSKLPRDDDPEQSSMAINVFRAANELFESKSKTEQKTSIRKKPQVSKAPIESELESVSMKNQEIAEYEQENDANSSPNDAPSGDGERRDSEEGDEKQVEPEEEVTPTGPVDIMKCCEPSEKECVEQKEEQGVIEEAEREQDQEETPESDDEKESQGMPPGPISLDDQSVTDLIDDDGDDVISSMNTPLGPAQPPPAEGYEMPQNLSQKGTDESARKDNDECEVRNAEDDDIINNEDEIKKQKAKQQQNFEETLNDDVMAEDMMMDDTVNDMNIVVTQNKKHSLDAIEETNVVRVEHDSFDPKCKHSDLMIDDKSIFHTGDYDDRSGYLSNLVSDGVHKWTIKVDKYYDSDTVWQLIGGWKTKYTPIIDKLFEENENQSYGFVLNLGYLSDPQKKGEKLRDYGSKCKEGGEITVILNLIDDTLSFLINGEHCGKAFDVEHTSYKLAVSLSGTGTKYRLLSYQYTSPSIRKLNPDLVYKKIENVHKKFILKRRPKLDGKSIDKNNNMNPTKQRNDKRRKWAAKDSANPRRNKPLCRVPRTRRHLTQSTHSEHRSQDGNKKEDNDLDLHSGKSQELDVKNDTNDAKGRKLTDSDVSQQLSETVDEVKTERESPDSESESEQKTSIRKKPQASKAPLDI